MVTTTAPTTGKDGLGTTIKMGNGASPEVFSQIANVVTLDGPGETMATIDATHLLSPGFYMEKVAGLLDGGQVTLMLQFDPAQPTHNLAIGLKHKLSGRILTNFIIDFSLTGLMGDNTIAFSAFVTNLGKSVAVGKLVEQAVTLMLSGPTTWAPAA